ncbi:MAG TPA: CotH kinase family protein [Ilumatobacteraceae bacterium]|nr:CotH kinase family protein [Ilumatobacteraceae bacterium]
MRASTRLQWRRQRTKLVGLAALAVTGLVAFADVQVTPVVGRGGTAPTGVVAGQSILGSIDLFGTVAESGGIGGAAVVHQMAIDFAPDDYRAMIAAYVADGTKRYIRATVVIDGTRIDNVGVRLKGNSTLEDAVFFPQPEEDGDIVFDDDAAEAAGSNALDFNTEVADDPSLVPLLIRFDWFVAGQRYQGYDEIAMRFAAYGMAGFNEAVGLEMIGAVGEPVQQWAYSTVTINGGPAQLRLLVEVPTAAFVARNFDHPGVLYRATGESLFDFVGDDPALYADQFEQIAPPGPVDLTPVIDLIRWTGQASDDEFAAGLAERVELDSLAEYLAAHTTINNWDDMGGGGRNYYLWYDLTTRRFTVVSWDVNLAFYRSVFRQRDADARADQPLPAPVQDDNGDWFVDLQPVLVGDPGSNNLLKTRFLDTPAFAARYDAAVAADCATLIDGGAAASSFAAIVQTVLASGAVTPADIHDEVDVMRTALVLKSDQCQRTPTN